MAMKLFDDNDRGGMASSKNILCDQVLRICGSGATGERVKQMCGFGWRGGFARGNFLSLNTAQRLPTLRRKCTRCGGNCTYVGTVHIFKCHQGFRIWALNTFGYIDANRPSLGYNWHMRREEVTGKCLRHTQHQADCITLLFFMIEAG